MRSHDRRHGSRVAGRRIDSAVRSPRSRRQRALGAAHPLGAPLGAGRADADAGLDGTGLAAERAALSRPHGSHRRIRRRAGPGARAARRGRPAPGPGATRWRGAHADPAARRASRDDCRGPGGLAGGRTRPPTAQRPAGPARAGRGRRFPGVLGGGTRRRPDLPARRRRQLHRRQRRGHGGQRRRPAPERPGVLRGVPRAARRPPVRRRQGHRDSGHVFLGRDLR